MLKRIEATYSPVHAVPEDDVGEIQLVIPNKTPMSVAHRKAYGKVDRLGTSKETADFIQAGLDTLEIPTLYPAEVIQQEKLSPAEARRFRTVKSFSISHGRRLTRSASREPQGTPTSFRKRWQVRCLPHNRIVERVVG